MADISALTKALPISGLEPEWVAIIGGLVDATGKPLQSIALLEPPAGQRTPYIEPVQALTSLLRAHGFTLEGAENRADAVVAGLKDGLEAALWVSFFDFFEAETPDCLPVSHFLAWLREQALAPSDAPAFLERVAEVAATTPMFRGPDSPDVMWSLENAPALPPPRAMIEFVPGVPWAGIDIDADEKAFLAWRETIRPVAQSLQETLGEAVYYFSDWDDDLDDDDVHRFLVLHWCCTHKPESAFVRYLLRASGARDVDDLKAALIAPSSYALPYEMNDSFVGIESASYRIDYVSPRRTQVTASREKTAPSGQ